MKILYVINSGNPGGLEQHVLDLVKGMVSKNHKVFVWCKPGDITKWYKDAGAIVEEHILGFELDFKYIFLLKAFLEKNKIDVIHTGELKAGVNGLIAGVLARTKVRITHIHTPMSEWRVTGTFKKIYTKFEIKLYSFLVNTFSSKEIALTETRKTIKLLEGEKESKLAVIPNALDLSRLNFSKDQLINFRAEICSKYHIDSNKIILGNVSRLTEEKGHQTLIEAYAQFVNNSPQLAINTHLFLAGGGKLELQLNALIKKLELDNRVTITGIFEASDWHKYYSMFDIFVFPSLAEGFGYVLVEGMYMGIPVISSDLPVLKEVGGGTVIFFNTNDARDLSVKLTTSVKNYDLENRWANTNAKIRVIQNYSMEKFVENYERLYESIISR